MCEIEIYILSRKYCQNTVVPVEILEPEVILDLLCTICTVSLRVCCYM